MRIDETRRGRSSLKIDDLRAAVDERRDLIVRSDSGDLSARHRDRLCDRVARIDGQDLAVSENEIGGARHLQRVAEGRDGDERQSESGGGCS